MRDFNRKGQRPYSIVLRLSVFTLCRKIQLDHCLTLTLAHQLKIMWWCPSVTYYVSNRQVRLIKKSESNYSAFQFLLFFTKTHQRYRY